MDWNLNPTDKQKADERELDKLDHTIEQRPNTRYSAQAHSVNLQDLLQLRNCVSGRATEPGRNTVSTFKKTNAARNKWFDAK